MEPQNESTLEPVTTRSVGMRYGLFLAAIGIVSFLVTTLSGINVTDGMNAWVYRAVSAILSFFILYLAHQYFKENGDGFMTYGQGLGIGFWATLTSSILSSLFVYIYVKFFDSGFIDMIKDKQLEEMQKRGMSDEQIAQAMKFASMFTTPEAILIFGIIGGLIVGILIALIITIFTQKTNPDAAPI